MIYYNLLVSSILFVLLLICIWNIYILKRGKPKHYSNEQLPFISVLVPARNEERNIRSILTSLLEQDYPRFEVIVLNDNSEDDTSSIIDEIKQLHPALRIINGKPLESGWTGKCFACKQLFEASKGDYLLFADADTIHFPGSLRNTVSIALSQNSDMLTLIPKFIMQTFSEKLLMPMLVFSIMMLLPIYFVDKKRFTKFAAGIGPFMLFKRSAYEKIGGHEAVKSALVEDVWLARRIKEFGLKLTIADGTDVLSVRMYNGFREIWQGFSKNIFAGFGYSTPWLIAVNTMFVLLFFVPFILFAIEVSLHSFSTAPSIGADYALIFTGIQILTLYIARFLLSARFRLGIVSSFLHPFGAVMVPVIAFNSWIWIRFGKGSKWKGRVYDFYTK